MCFPCRTSPAPDLWPQAERRLSDNYHMHNKVPHRSCTVPRLDITADPELQAAIAHRHGSLPLVGNGLFLPLGHSGSGSLPGDSTPIHGSEIPDSYPASRHDSIVSDNLTQVRLALLQGLPTINEAETTQLLSFAAIAEENARVARRLADRALEIARSASSANLQNGVLSLNYSDGSSVDPPSEDLSSLEDRPSEKASSTKDAQGYRNYCHLM